jgi:hypothetical protein
VAAGSIFADTQEKQDLQSVPVGKICNTCQLICHETINLHMHRFLILGRYAFLATKPVLSLDVVICCYCYARNLGGTYVIFQ